MEHKNLKKIEIHNIEKHNICLRCGLIGHDSEKCNEKIPTIKEMTNIIEKSTNDIIKYPPKEWELDEFGYYLPTDNRIINSKYSWKDGDFCFNCGNYGHKNDVCKEPNFTKLLELFSPLIGDNSNKASLEKNHLIDAINQFCSKS